MRGLGRKTWAVLVSAGLHAAAAVSLAHWPRANVDNEVITVGPLIHVHAGEWPAQSAADKLLAGLELASDRLTAGGVRPAVFSVPLANVDGVTPAQALEPTSAGAAVTEQSLPLTTASGQSLAGAGSSASTGSTGSISADAAGPQGGGARAPTTFFGVPAQGDRIVYVLDRSLSMGLNGALAHARRELVASLRQLHPAAQFQVIAYNTKPQVLLGQAAALAPATPENIAVAIQALESLEPLGGTEHLPALTLALNARPSVIYFLTDADDLKPDELTETTKRNTQRAAINTIELTTAHRGQPAMPMQTLSRTTGGHYHPINLQNAPPSHFAKPPSVLVQPRRMP